MNSVFDDVGAGHKTRDGALERLTEVAGAPATC